MSRLLALALLLAPSAHAGDAPDHPLLAPLVAELERSVAELSLPGAPPIYHLRYRLLSLDQVDAEASLGSLLRASSDPLRMAFVELRVGDPSYDNTGFGGWQNGFQSASLPMTDDAHATTVALWRATDRAYKEAVEQLSRKAAQFEPPEDYPGDYTLTGAVVDDLGHATPSTTAGLQALARDLSAQMVIPLPEGVVLERGVVHLGHEMGSALLIDTEGTRLRTPMAETTLRASLQLRSPDGLSLSDQRLWTVRDPGELPAFEDLAEAVDAMVAGLADAATAPLLQDEYVGPVVFEDGAARDLFRYLLLPQLQGTPPEVPFDSWFGELGGGSANAVRVKRRVLPLGWSAEDDPERDPDHPGAYRYDAEGTPAQSVRLIEEGIVQDLLMSRVPRKGMTTSNGHARGGMGDRAQGRPTLIEISPPRHVSERKLVARALRLAASYGHDHVMVVRRLQDPSTRSLDPMASSWLDPDAPQLPVPVALVKRYADGREEVLRGAQFSGVQRFVLRDIVLAGPSTSGSFMAAMSGEPWTYGPTEGLPTWIRAPSVLVGEMEIVPRPPDPKRVPIVPPPPLATR